MKEQIEKLLERYRATLKSRQDDTYNYDCEEYRAEGEILAYEEVIDDLENLLAHDKAKTEHESDFEKWWQEAGKVAYPVEVMELAFKEIAFRGWNASVGHYFGYKDYFES